MMELQVKGTQSFMDKEIPVVEGGFGEGKRSLTDKAISKVHTQPTREIRKSINRNIKRFKEGVDFIDLKDGNEITNNLLVSLGYTKMEISKATNIYLLSERGYAKLIKIMDTDLAWEIHDKLIDEYFTMREVINSNEQLKAKLLLDIYNGGQEGIVASRELVELEKKPLLEKIEKDEPKVTFANRVLKSNDNVLVRQVAKMVSDEGFVIGERKLYKKLREWGYICNDSTEPTQVGMNRNYFTLKINVLQTPYGMKTSRTTLVTPKGQIHIVKRLLKEMEIE